jgi:hypothetical protein
MTEIALYNNNNFVMDIKEFGEQFQGVFFEEKRASWRSSVSVVSVSVVGSSAEIELLHIGSR